MTNSKPQAGVSPLPLSAAMATGDPVATSGRGAHHPAFRREPRLRTPNTLDQLADWLRFEEAPNCADPRNAAWAIEAADELTALTSACRILIAQYEASSDFVMGGKLTNEPFLAIKELVK